MIYHMTIGQMTKMRMSTGYEYDYGEQRDYYKCSLTLDGLV